MTGRDLVTGLTYASYAANRDYAPHITPKQWQRIYGPAVWAMEARYAAEMGALVVGTNAPGSLTTSTVETTTNEHN